MSLSTDNVVSTGSFRLEGALDIYAAERLRETLQGCVAACGPIILDLGGVETCDATGVQLLLSAWRTAAEAGGALRFESVPESVGRCCQRLGLPDMIVSSTPDPRSTPCRM